MDKDERAAVLAKLEETRGHFLASVQGLREDQATWKPTAERWSILECTEHVAAVEHGILYRLTKEILPRADGSAGTGREQQIFAQGADRSSKRQAPANVIPTGRYKTLDEAMQAFALKRAETILWVEDCGKDLRALTTQHPALGEITGQELLALLIVHPARHALQVCELREHPQFPQ